MNLHDNKSQENESRAIANNDHTQKTTTPVAQFVDNRPEAVAQLKLQEGIKESSGTEPVQMMEGDETEAPALQGGGTPNNTGLPDDLKAGIEKLSGLSMDDVKVHYGSGEPEQLGALAYAQGTDIYIGPGQEEHLAHEAWHVVQQKEGRVAKTMQLKGGVGVNDDSSLEKEADVMGEKALGMGNSKVSNDNILDVSNSGKETVQRKVAINNTEIDSVVQYLIDNDLDWLLSVEESAAAGWMLGIDELLAFDNPTDVFLEANRIYGTASLIRSIFTTGILSRSELEKREMNYTGSEDSGSKGDLAVNILDNRAGERTPKSITNESLTSEDRGSISVALERENDWVKSDELVKPENVSFSKEELEELEKTYGEDLHIVLPTLKRNKAMEINKLKMAGILNQEMSDRAMSTIMAGVPNPNEKMAFRSEDSRSYESSEPSGQIKPGEGGFTTLLIPEWFQPYYIMLEKFQPQDVTIKFVGTKKVTANYKTSNGHIPVEVDAPDYESEVTPLLDEFKLLATHILTV